MITNISGKPIRMALAFFQRASREEGVVEAIVASGRRTGLTVVLALAAAAAALGAVTHQFSTSVNLVEAYVTVTDRSGTPVTGLRAGDFEVLDDGRPQAIQAFAAGDFPLSVALAIDHSASMAGPRLRLASVAAQSFLGRLRPTDRVMVIGISSEVETLAPLSTDRSAQTAAIQGLQPWSTTSLNDAIIAGIDLIQPAGGRRGLVVLSDGEDRYSEATAAQVLARARRSDVMVYPVALGAKVPALFPELSVTTGGRSFHVADPARLDQALADIARELRYQYLLGYAPAGQEPAAPAGTATEARWHTIQVRVKRADVQVRARDGYYGR